MAVERELKEINIRSTCPGKCDECETYFECDLDRKEVFKKKGILKFIDENLKEVKHKILVLGGKGGVGKSMLSV
ncbi:MAG: hypothetical protein JRD71_01390, partial [Deltaproteobacteria bacterium]|nr:hypothetical protein [Deltaproteobacteria bacterium]